MKISFALVASYAVHTASARNVVPDLGAAQMMQNLDIGKDPYHTGTPCSVLYNF